MKGGVKKKIRKCDQKRLAEGRRWKENDLRVRKRLEMNLKEGGKFNQDYAEKVSVNDTGLLWKDLMEIGDKDEQEDYVRWKEKKQVKKIITYKW
jgi:hypothetical protein